MSAAPKLPVELDTSARIRASFVVYAAERLVDAGRYREQAERHTGWLRAQYIELADRSERAGRAVLSNLTKE